MTNKINIYIEDNLTWRIEKKALKYGEDLRLYCQVEKCCTKSAGWGKWTSDDKFNTIFIDVKDFLNDGSSKYGGGIEKTGWFLIIRNITKNDLNTSYSCTYGFQVSKKKMLLEEDAFSGKYSLLFTFQNQKNGKSDNHIHCIKLVIEVNNSNQCLKHLKQ